MPEFRIRGRDGSPNALTDVDRVATLINDLMNGAEGRQLSARLMVGQGEHRSLTTFRVSRRNRLINFSLEKGGGGVELSGPYRIVPGFRQIDITVTSVRLSGLGRLARISQRTSQISIKGIADGSIMLELSPVTKFSVLGTDYVSVSKEHFR
jgi:hypothetical protein